MNRDEMYFFFFHWKKRNKNSS